MKQQFVTDTMHRLLKDGYNLEAAIEYIIDGMGVSYSQIKPAVDAIKAEIERNSLLDYPPSIDTRPLATEIGLAAWYVGEHKNDKIWPRLREKMEHSSLKDAVTEIDDASRKVVSLCAAPTVHHMKKRGMVVGYVQSGKTANYTAVMAKAADAGYQLFIVLAGMHNNLRRQTQIRIQDDLLDKEWLTLTTEDDDFGRVYDGSAALANKTKSIAIVKKNQRRLRALRDWLRDIPEELRARVPVMILDDEADQATPNSSTRLNEQSRINQLIREIWSEVKTGTYIGYTATPFANVFMDPNDEEELYPADFIVALPKPRDYFGAEQLFGREPLDDSDQPYDGLDVIRIVPDEDAEQLRPPSAVEFRRDFCPHTPNSLRKAVAWFIVATAIRRARGQQDKHSSMLIHTTHYTDPHFAMKSSMEELLNEFTSDIDRGDYSQFEESYDHEATRAQAVATKHLPNWNDTAIFIPAVVGQVRVIVDNGQSEDRLDYNRVDSLGKPSSETIIAVGGGTLSRGLTLEGLIVSYFIRTSNTYDTLLQMSRWFGFRPGYEDLPRIWMPSSLSKDFQFLALVEEELRREINRFSQQNLTPREAGLRIRQHPGRLDIVARNKMQHAKVVWVSYSGRRLQTFILHETDKDIQQNNLNATKALIAECNAQTETMFKQIDGREQWVARSVSATTVNRFLSNYTIHPDLLSMQSKHITSWIHQHTGMSTWNIVVKGNTFLREKGDESAYDPVDIGLDSLVAPVNRAPLASSPIGTANIKSLLSRSDWFADMENVSQKETSTQDPATYRRLHAHGKGLIVIYPVNPKSVPMGAAKRAGSRRDMQSELPLIGVGIIFPNNDAKHHAQDGTYLAVEPDWDNQSAPEEDEPLPADTEGSAAIKAAN